MDTDSDAETHPKSFSSDGGAGILSPARHVTTTVSRFITLMMGMFLVPRVGVMDKFTYSME